MARGSSCAGADNTAAPEYLEEVRRHIKAHPERYRGRTHVDQVGPSDRCCCLMEDWLGERCPGDECYIVGAGGKKKRDHRQDLPL